MDDAFATSASSSSGVERHIERRASDDVRWRPPLAVPNRSDSASPSSSSRLLHNHLGLRPKASDSLHTRLRNSNPTPKHISKIEDVTSYNKLRKKPTISRETSNESSRPGTSRQMSMDGSDYSIDPTHSEIGHDTDPVEEYEEITTDIGLYDEAVYDEYLGAFMGSLRRKLIKSLRWESPILARHQVRNIKF